MTVTTPEKRRLGLPMAGLAVALLVVAPSVPAADLDQAKQQGLVCEMSTGYLRSNAAAPSDVRAMVDSINTKRRAEYARIADQHGITVQQVGEMTAQKLSPRCR